MTKLLATSVALSGLLALTLGCEDPGPASGPPLPTVAPKPLTSATATATGSASAEYKLPKLAYFPDMPIPADNPLTAAKVSLGKMLFFDKRLGKDGQFSCESCHFVDKGWADGLALSTAGTGKVNSRHTPALFNVGYNQAWYWDGRAPTLEAQVLAAWKGQMGAADDLDGRVAGIAKLDGYRKAFKAAFGDDKLTSDRVVKAIASFVRTVLSGNAPWDKHELGLRTAVGEDAARGWALFRDKAGCAACHVPPLYTDLKYHNLGVGYDKKDPDKGRGAITKDEKDNGRFKTPSLRSVTLHPPYLHDGSAKTIEEVVDYMLSGGRANEHLDSGFKKVTLTKEERADLLAFIQSLTAPMPAFVPPTLP